MKRVFIACAVLLLLPGCATKVETGGFFNLTFRNVVTRDLTRPAALDNESAVYEYRHFPQELPFN